MDFNRGFAAVLQQARASFPGLAIYLPDAFATLDDMVAHPSDYGLSKVAIDALDDPALTDRSLNGPGASYLFWDYLDPSAKVHARLADITQQLVSPVSIASLTPLGASNELDVWNIPVGLNGFVQMSADFSTWATGPGITSTNATQAIVVPESGLLQYYRLAFPFAWSWP